MAVPASLQRKIDVFEANARVFRYDDELFTETGWAQIMLGQGLEPRGYHPLADQVSDQQLAAFLETVEGLVAGNVATLEPHTAFVERCCKAQPAV